MQFVSAWWDSLPAWAKGVLPVIVVLGALGLLAYALGLGLDVMQFFRWLGELVGE